MDLQSTSWRWLVAVRAVPLARAPVRWHVMAACGLVLVVAGACLVLAAQMRMALDRALTHQLDAQAQLRSSSSPDARKQLMPELALLEAKRLDDVVRDISRFAAQRNLRVGSLRIEHAAPGGRLAQVQLTIATKGAYGDLKSWLSELLARYPSVALKSLALQAPPPGSAMVSANLTLTLFMKSAQ